MSFLKKVVAKVRSAFMTLKNRVVGVFKKKKATRRQGKMAMTTRAKKISSPYVPPSAPAPVAAPTPAAPVQAAGKKMRAKNLRGMKFYKPSRKAVKKGRKLSRRR